MCGIFGYLRKDGVDPLMTSLSVKYLGLFSESRGRDASGIATINFSKNYQPIHPRLQLDKTVVRNDFSIFKDTVPFEKFYDESTMLPSIKKSECVIGHTRAASQGHRGEIRNASPLLTESLICSHNGDVDKQDIFNRYSINRSSLIGETDTEVMYRAIESAGVMPEELLPVLSNIRGSLALAWVDRRCPNQVRIAVGCYSPLYLAFDKLGSIYWGSSDSWFFKIDNATNRYYDFNSITRVKSGTFLILSKQNGKVFIGNRYSFNSTPRYNYTNHDRYVDFPIKHSSFSYKAQQEKERDNKIETIPKKTVSKNPVPKRTVSKNSTPKKTVTNTTEGNKRHPDFDYYWERSISEKRAANERANKIASKILGLPTT